MTWILRLFTGLKGYAIAAAGAVAAIALVYLKGSKAGKDAVRAEHAEKAVKASKKANEIRDKNTAAAESDINSRLRKFQRK